LLPGILREVRCGADTDPDGNTTLSSYDERGRKTEVKVPHSGTGGDTTYRTTRYEYDQVGNATRVITPRGTETANADDFTKRTEYDALNRPVKQYLPYNPYNGALADMGLGSDPFTGNRYAFTGGNPISNVEIDGHCSPSPSL
jgi:YD repeat-containing protein